MIRAIIDAVGRHLPDLEAYLAVWALGADNDPPTAQQEDYLRHIVENDVERTLRAVGVARLLGKDEAAAKAEISRLLAAAHCPDCPQLGSREAYWHCPDAAYHAVSIELFAAHAAIAAMEMAAKGELVDAAVCSISAVVRAEIGRFPEMCKAETVRRLRNLLVCSAGRDSA